MARPAYSTVYLSAWWLAVVSMPWYILPNSICVGLLFLVWLADGNFPEKWNRLKSSKWAWPFFAFFFLHLTGLLYSEDVQAAWFQIETKLSLAALPLIAATARPLPENSFRVLKNGFIGSCLAVVLASLAAAAIAYFDQTGQPLNFDPYTTDKFHSLFPNLAGFWEYFSYRQLSQWVDIHPAFFSMYLNLCVLIIIQDIFDHSRLVVLRTALVILFIFFISLLSSRMALASLAVTMSFLVLFHFIRMKQFRRGFTVLSGLLVLLLLFIWVNPVTRFHFWIEPLSTPLTADQHTPHWNSVNLRLLSWEASYHTVRNFWPMGTGTGDGQAVLNQYYASLGILGYNVNSHNQYLQTFIELGVPGIASLLFCMYSPLCRAFRENPVHFSFMLLFGMMCLTESMLARPKGIVFFAIFQSLFLSLEPRSYDR